MEIESLIKLIDKVSASELSEFSLEEGNVKLKLKKEKKEVPTAETEGIPQILREAQKVPLSEKKAGNQQKSPLVGTFYNAPSPEAEPYVKPGDTVKKGQILGIIEAMKLMNEIESEYDGVVEEVLVENEAMVEYGQPLFVIR